MAIDNYENHTMLVNMSSGVSNIVWSNMIDEMYNGGEDVNMATDENVPDEKIINPKAQKLRLTKLTKYKEYEPEQDLSCDK